MNLAAANDATPLRAYTVQIGRRRTETQRLTFEALGVDPGAVVNDHIDKCEPGEAIRVWARDKAIALGIVADTRDQRMVANG